MKLRLAVIFTGSTLLAQSNTYMLRATRLFDGASDALVQPGVIVVANGMIQSVGSRAALSGATVIDLGDATLLPGFIDAHTPLSYDFNPDYNGARLLDLERPVPEKAIRATANARKTLMAGFTTVRGVGSSDFIDVGLRNAINAGLVAGPRMLVSVHALGSTSGHCDDGAGFRFGALSHESRPEEGVINSPDEATRSNTAPSSMTKRCA